MPETRARPADNFRAWIRLDALSWRWTVHPDWAALLLDRSGLRLDEWRERRWVTVVKSAPHRTVYRIALPTARIYVKHYPLADLRAQVRQQLRPSKARTEAATALELAARDVPTIAPLAIGETAAGESYLVSNALEETRTLKEFIEYDLPALPAAERDRRRRELAITLADFLARMHDAGVQHADLHAGNILVQPGPEMLMLFLIDLHEVRLGPPLDWPASRENLILLNRWFVQRSSRTDRLRCWHRYVSQRHTLPLTSAVARELGQDLEQRTWESCLAFWRKRDRRCLGTNRYFYQLALGNHRAWAVRDLPPEVLRGLLANPDRPFEQPVKLLKHSRSSTVAEIDLVIDGQPRRLIWKRFAVTKWSDPWTHLARPTPALRSWVNGHRLLECGLPTARPLAAVQRHRSGLPQECYLLTEMLPGVVDLHTYVGSLPLRADVVRPLIEQVARLVRQLHRRQLSHPDLKAANIQVGKDGQLYLIDLVGVERWRKLPSSRQVQNLARLHASFHDHRLLSRTDKLRFLRCYLAWGLHGKAGWKDWWREISEATLEKIARNRQRGRPLS